MKKPVSVSALTHNLYMTFVRPAMLKAGMLEKVPMQDEWHEFIGEVTDEAFALEIESCMRRACFIAHDGNRIDVLTEAEWLLKQLSFSMVYHPEMAATLEVLYDAINAMITGENAVEEENRMENVNEIMKSLAEYTLLQEQATDQVKALQNQLKAIMQERGLECLQGDEHKATYKAVVSSRIDSTALKKELPDIAARYTVPTSSMRFTFN